MSIIDYLNLLKRYFFSQDAVYCMNALNDPLSNALVARYSSIFYFQQ